MAPCIKKPLIYVKLLVYKVQFLKSIPHKNVLNHHSKSDIYISSNTDGNLINTNLEAISSNACMIILNHQKNKNRYKNLT